MRKKRDFRKKMRENVKRKSASAKKKRQELRLNRKGRNKKKS